MKKFIQELQIKWAMLPRQNQIAIIAGSILIILIFFVSMTWILISGYKDRQYSQTMKDLEAQEAFYKQRALNAENQIENLDAQVEVLLNKLKTVQIEREKADKTAQIARNKAVKSGELYEKNKNINPIKRADDSIISDDELCTAGRKAGIIPEWCN